MSHTPISRSSTPSRLTNRASSANIKPKVLPFPDLGVRTSFSMSREPSRATSPIGSPGLLASSSNNSTANNSSIAIAQLPGASSSHYLASSPSSLSVTYAEAASPPSSSRLAQSASPTSASPLALATPRPQRPRAATTSAQGSTLAHLLSRTDSFHGSSRPSTPSAAMATTAVAPVVAVSHTAAAGSSTGLTGILLSSSPERSASHNTPRDPTPPRPTPPRETPRETPRPPMPVKKPSNPPNPLPASIAVTPPPPPGTLVEHLHRSFKSGACADVRLWVRKWGVGWHVHKMVLVQAGFFHSLFMGAFSENAPGSFKAKGKGTTTVQPSPDDDWTGEDIELTFDDPNITRAAFEICLSRLYSPYPLLHFPLSLLPTASQPLTPSYPPTTPFPSLQTTYHSMAQNNHLVSPRLLLSLLATATYLGQQYLLREVLAIVLRTVGPATVGRYLSFAIGNGVGEEEWTGQDDEGAYGLETIARTMSSGFTAHAESDEWVSESDEGDLPDLPGAPPGHRMSTDSNVDDVVAKVSDVSVSRSASIRSSSTLRPGGSSVLVQVDEEADANLPPLPHFYGFVSNKLGEACVCWLSRWGLDTLNIEAALPDTMAETDPYPPPVWGQGGIPANFVAALLSSDALFVPNEMERYRMARQVLDLRRAGWTAYAEEQPDSSNVSEADSIEGWDEDERELSKVFAEGIYYSHMTFDDLSSISSDVDPTTALPYAPLSVLQAAHWSAADLKNRVLNEKVPASALEGELGLTQSTTDLCAVYARRRAPRRAGSPYDSGMRGSISFSSLSLGTNRNSGGPAFHPVPSDDTHRIGAGGLLFFDSKVAASAPLPGIPGLPDHGPEWGDETTTKGKARPPPQNESTFFGVIRGSKTGPEIEDKFREDGGLLVPLPGMDKSKEDKWSKMEPFRFSVEFWGVDKLAEKERLYSQTHFYAGSYFNVYVSTIRKKDKGVQLGIYLHRQSPTEPFPSVSTSPVGVSSTATGVTFHSSDANSTGVNSAGTSPDEPNAANPMASTYSLVPPQMASVYRTMSISPPQLGSPPAHHDSLSDGEVRTQTSGGYLDPRRVTKAYFSISCASALGTALVRFSSAPDSFALSQSWGWKSSALRSEEYLSVPIPADKEGGESTLGWVGESPEGGSLRATVVVGVI